MDTVGDPSDVKFMDSTDLAWLLRSRDLIYDRDRRFMVVVPEVLDPIFEVSGLAGGV